MNKHRVALIGGIGAAAKVWAGLPEGCELVGVCDLREDVLERVRREAPELLVTKDYREIAQMPGCDSVVTFTPNETHRDIAVACLEGGKNVFIEKPMGITREQGREILAAEKRSGKTVAVDLEFRASRVGRTVRNLIDSGEIGELRQVEIDHHRGGWTNDTPQGCYRTKRRTSGYFKLEGIHMLDLLRFWAGEMETCRVFSSPNTLPQYEFPDNYTVMIRFANGVTGRYSGSHNKVGHSAGGSKVEGARQGHLFRMALAGTRGAVEVNLWEGYINVFRYMASPVGSDSLKPEFERRIDYSGLPLGAMDAGHDIAGCRQEFLRRMAAGDPPYQSATDAWRSELISFAIDDCTDSDGGLIDCRQLFESFNLK
ncbi:MAG: Gfo/Idh/MocA family protein [Spartobacteria bacterium]